MEKTFEREFNLHVPARGLFGGSPTREQVFEFTVPDDYEIKRNSDGGSHGAVVVGKNLANLDERRLAISAIPNGVRLDWKLKNPHTFPVSGRTGAITLRLVGVESETLSDVHLAFTPKYRAIRERFFENFYYAGHVAELIDGNRIKFADQTIYMGQTLILLATEIYIKRRSGEDPAPSIQKVKEMFAAIDELDRAAEELYGHPPQLNGFIVRDNISGADDPRLNGRFNVVEPDWQKPENAAPSGDQVFGLLYGLWFVVNFSEDDELIARAQELCDRIFVQVKDKRFELTLPDGKVVKRGSDIRWLSSLLHGLNYSITGIPQFDECQIEVLGQKLKLTPIASFWDNAGDDAADWLRTELDIPILGKQSINSFAAHIVLMAIAPSEVWSKQELEEAALAVNHHFAVLMRAVAHNDTPDALGYSDIREILDRCPDDGPRSDLPVEAGWQKDNRWIRCSNIHTPGSGHKQYNGVDFLMLHNLARIVFSE